MLLKTIQPNGHRYRMLRKGLGVFYNEKDGCMVLRGEARWYKISGIWINTEKGCLWVKFRRFSSYEKQYKEMI